jgi:hypothetical protein
VIDEPINVYAIMKRVLFILIAAAIGGCPILAQDNLQITSLQYWIDDDQTATSIISEMEFSVNCSTLAPGFHTLHYRVADNNGHYSALQEHGFFKVAPVSMATAVESVQYWWDDMQQDAITMPYTADEITLPAGSFPVGLHSLKYRMKDNAGRWSGLYSHYFYKGEVRNSARIVSYSYWWNDLTEQVITHQLERPAVSFELDEDFTVPQEARTGYAGHYTATLNIVITDNHGASSYLTADVEYPDNDAPVTDIDADKYVSSSTVNLTWTESTNDKMGDYNVYVSKDNGPFMLWLPDTKQTKATFKGELGSVYLFTVTGRDAFGNRERYDETKCVSVTFE